MMPENPFTPGTQAYFLYEHLCIHRAVTTKEMHNYLRVDTARIRDCRKYLKAYGFNIYCKYLEPGNRLYEVRP